MSNSVENIELSEQDCERLKELIKTKTKEENDHLIWIGGRDDSSKSSHFLGFNGVRKHPHQWIYLMKKKIPPNHILIQICDQDYCVNHWVIYPKAKNGQKVEFKDLHDETIEYKLAEMKKNCDQKNNCLISRRDHVNFQKSNITISRLAYSLYHKQEIPKDNVIIHTCGNHSCITESHLQLRHKNQSSTCLSKNKLKGEDNPKSRLKEKDIFEILELRKNGLSFEKIGDRFSVAKKTIMSIFQGKTWSSVSGIKKSPIMKQIKRELLTESDFKQAQNYIKNRIELIDGNQSTKCWKWTKAKDKKGYGIGSFRKVYRAHKLSYCAFNQIKSTDILKGQVIRHKCILKSCVNHLHLEIGTFLDNSNDMIRDGTLLIGEKHPSSQISEKKAKEIIASKNLGMTRMQRSKMHNVTPAIITSIDCKKAWKHVQISNNSKE